MFTSSDLSDATCDMSALELIGQVVNRIALIYEILSRWCMCSSFI